MLWQDGQHRPHGGERREPGRLAAPERTRFLQVWIHSFNASQVEAYLDDLEIVRTDE